MTTAPVWLTVAALLADGDGADGTKASPPSPEELLARTYVTKLALAPDGRRALVFEVGGAERTAQLVELDFSDAGVHRSAFPIDDDTWGHVAWNPRGDEVAFQRGAPPRSELWLATPKSAPTRALSPAVSSSIFALFWRRTLAGGELLALHDRVDAHSRLAHEAVLSPVRLDHDEFGDDLVRFGTRTIKEATLAPDGRTLAIVATDRPSYAPEGEPLDLWLVDVESASFTLLTHGDVIVAKPRFSPDSARVACVLQRGRHSLESAKRDVVVFDVATGTSVVATAKLDLSIGDGIFGADEELWFTGPRTLLLATQHGLADDLLEVELPERPTSSSGAAISAASNAANPTADPICRFVATGERSWQQLCVASDGRRLALESGASQPEQVVLAEAPDFTPRVVEAPNGGLASRPLGRSSVVAWRGADGLAFDGLWIEPATRHDATEATDATATPRTSFPTIVLLHGGSSGRQTLRFDDGFAQAYVSLGYALCAPNLRGSAGYGVAFDRANEGDFGGQELADLEVVVDDLVARGVADPKRIYLLGHSYGGFLVELELTRSHRFAAACAASAVSDWSSFAKSSDLPLLATIGFPSDAAAREQRWRERSPLQLEASIATPLLLVHGEKDRRVPFSQSDLLFCALEKRDAECELVALPGVGHVLSTRAAALQWIHAADEFFKGHSPAAPR